MIEFLQRQQVVRRISRSGRRERRGSHKGEVVVVCGPSGSGKSTLIRTVNRLEEIRPGAITFDGQDIHDKRAAALNAYRCRIGFVFQQFNLFPHLTVLQNCTLAPMRCAA